MEKIEVAKNDIEERLLVGPAGLGYYSHSLPAHSLRNLTSFTRKVLVTFHPALNPDGFIAGRELVSSPVMATNKKTHLHLRSDRSFYLVGPAGLEPATNRL